MQWSFSPELPLYVQLKARMTEDIAAGRYAPGSQLPTVRELAVQAGVNPNTVQRALCELEQEGLVFVPGTQGRFVTQDEALIEDKKNAIAMERAEAYFASMERLGFDRCSASTLLMKEDTQ